MSKTLIVYTSERETTETTWNIEVPDNFDASYDNEDEIRKLIETGKATQMGAETSYTDVNGRMEIDDFEWDDEK